MGWRGGVQAGEEGVWAGEEGCGLERREGVRAGVGITFLCGNVFGSLVLS